MPSSCLSHENEYVRAWAVQLIAEDRSAPDAALREVRRDGEGRRSALVRLYIASALQRVPVGETLGRGDRAALARRGSHRPQSAADGVVRRRAARRPRPAARAEHGGGLEAAAHVLVHGPAHRRAEDVRRRSRCSPRGWLARPTPTSRRSCRRGSARSSGASSDRVNSQLQLPTPKELSNPGEKLTQL